MMITPPVLQIECISAFSDNYLWLIHNGQHAAVVDPGDAAPIVAALARLNLTLCAILITHHHPDHCGGVGTLLNHAKVPVYGPADEAIPHCSHPLHDGQTVYLPELDWQLEVLAVPGHTLGHIAYHAPKMQSLFCGDTLFAGGCGRLFEGSPQQMVASLSKLCALPDATRVYCAHEYTLSNLKFAREVDPANPQLLARIKTEEEKRARGTPTVPSEIGLEKATNPFLRCDQSAIIEQLQQAQRLHGTHDPVQVFAALREWKNVYR